METFLHWAANLGISDSTDPSKLPNSCLGHSLSVADFPLAGGRGLGAARELRKGELLLKVPRIALMTSDSILAKDNKLMNTINLQSSLSPTQRLSVCLLYEMCKGKSSFWYQYLIHIPHDYDLLSTFGEFEKQALQVEDAIWVTEKAIAKSKSEWKEAVTLMNELELKPKFKSLQAWLWATSTISSRTLHVPWDSAGCLCPVADLFNYDAPGDDLNTSESTIERLTDGGFDEVANAYCLYARRNYRIGEQVLLCYGTYTNLELLEHYGFTLEHNSNDKVFIPLESSLYTLASSWPKDSLYIHQDGKPSFALVSTLRLWLIPQSQRDKSVMRLVYEGCQISVENEILVMKWLLEKCKSVLMDLPTSILEDIVILDDIDKLQDSELRMDNKEMWKCFGDEVRAFLDVNRLCEANGYSWKAKKMSRKWRLAVQWRLRYKTSLADCISYCNEKMNHLLATQNRIRDL